MVQTTPANEDRLLSEHWRDALESFGGVNFVVGIAQRAALVIMEIYNRSHIEEREKENGSPVSEADLAAAALIEMELKATGIPVVCEETVTDDATSAPLFWLVDPLDGTKEFLAKNGEFTVNIALIAAGEPVCGVIGIPVTGEVYCAVKGERAHRRVGDRATPIFNKRTQSSLIAAVSRSHASDAGDSWLSGFGVESRIQCGSAIKFCRVAEGKADLYVRFGRTMEWDTAAGQCILEASGCRVVVADTGRRLTYGKDGFDNPHFIACRGDLSVTEQRASQQVGNL